VKNLVLVGFMGSGKSCVGKQAAQKLDFQFVDTDELIERRMGKSINDIFARYGESFFRDLEKHVMRELAGRSRLVIATGGGAVIADENWGSWRRNGVIILLQVDAENAHQRTRHHTHRPLLQGTDSLVNIKELLVRRAARYAKADDVVDTVGRTCDQVVDLVLKKYEEHASRPKPSVKDK
jgi:shikimate kinase